MPTVIPLAHDVTCSWCWVVWHQISRLEQEFDVEFEWRPFELWPASLTWPEPAPPTDLNRPTTPSRFRLMCMVEGLEFPVIARPKQMRSHAALASIEFAKERGLARTWIDVLYAAYWERGEAIGENDVLECLAESFSPQMDGLRQVLELGTYSDRIVPFDDEAHAKGVWSLPTFWIAGERYAEQPLSVLRAALTAAGVARR